MFFALLLLDSQKKKQGLLDLNNLRTNLDKVMQLDEPLIQINVKRFYMNRR